MLYPKNFEEKIGFDKIRELLAAECQGPIGQAFVHRIRFTDRHDVILKLLCQTEEFRKIIAAGENFPDSHYLDVSGPLQKATIEGAFLTEDEFFDVQRSLRTLFMCLEFLAKKDPATCPHLKELSGAVALDPKVLRAIDQVIDERGKVKDTASPRLREVRSAILAAQASVRKRLDQLLRSFKAEGVVNDDASLTIREGRMVIPVPAEYKRRVKGFVHDTSASGQTVYIEPAEILEVNNEIRELEYEERHEIIRILTALTTALRPEVEPLKKGYFFLGLIDFIRAKARLAQRTRGVFPELEAKPLIQWTAARHPLLELHLRELGRAIVPLNIRLEAQNRILLISGPNAGGKSITLKTTGLVQYMLQCGLLPTIEEGSRVGLFEHLFIDIGDEQSIDNDLSTYSSHLKNMKSFLQFADGGALCLIDEFGTGTEPEFGGAIAEAILQALNDRQVFGVITTHYANLKFYAESAPGIVNGAMRFDVGNLEPLFQLDIGKPGSSFALEIAQKIGLPRTVTAAAREKVGKAKIDIEKLLRDLEREKKDFEDQNRSLAEKQRQLEKTLAEYTKLRDFIDQNRKQLLNEAKAEAKTLLRDANQKIEQAIREIRENQADKEKTKTVRQTLEDFKAELKPVAESPVPPTAQPTGELEYESGEVQAGDYVQLAGTNSVGEVLSLKGKEATVAFGDLKTNVKVSRLQKISRRSYRELNPARRSQGSTSFDLNQKAATFSLDLDVRGHRAEDALVEVEQFIDDAIMLSHQNLRILHGKGDGILRTLIRERLRKYREVAQLEDEHADRGGAGITLVRLR
jgi:DNA mismatch repair protein MutS2